MNNKSSAIETFEDRNTDLTPVIKEILLQISEKIGKKINVIKKIWQSDYFGNGKIGAVHFLISLENEQKEMVLKIQGAEPQVSEFEMIESFKKQNKSAKIRAPKILYYIPWSDEDGYEVLIMEYIKGKKVIQSGRLVTPENLDQFFNILQDYRHNCLNKPWLDRPELTISEFTLKSWPKMQALMSEIKPEHHLRQAGDKELLAKAVIYLAEGYKNVDWQFMHGHLSVEDMVEAETGEIVIFSNLFWKWKAPFYDMIFAYHWFLLSLQSIDEIDKKTLLEQKNMWIDKITTLVNIGGEENKKIKLNNEKLLSLALLERAIALLAVDGFAYINDKSSIVSEIIDSSRQFIKSTLQK